MQEQDGLTPDQRALESTLKSLSPATGRIDPIAAAFAAGQRSGRRQLRLWQAAAAFMLLIGAGSWLMPLRHSAVIRPNGFSEPAIAVQPPSQAEPPIPQSLQALQEAVNEKGVDGLPAANIPAVHLLRAQDNLNL